MKTFANTFFFALTFSAVTFTATGLTTAGVPKQPHRAAAYQVGIYGSADGTQLHVAIDKQLGGRVDLTLKDAAGTVLFHQLVRSSDEKYRAKLDVSSLAAGQYRLEISNGRETTVRPLTISTEQAVEAQRTIALL